MLFAISSIFGGCITLALGMLAAYFGGHSVALGMRSRTWPTYDGRVVSSQLHRRRRPNRTGHTYEAEVIYSFQDDAGQTRQSNRVHCGFAGPGLHGNAANLVERYPKDQRVHVYYDPNQPGYTVLEPGVSITSVFVTLLGLTFTIIGGLLMVGMIGPGS